MADWLDMLDPLIYNETERILLIKNHVWDVTIEGADVDAINTWMANNRKPPKAGSVRVHNCCRSAPVAGFGPSSVAR